VSRSTLGDKKRTSRRYHSKQTHCKTEGNLETNKKADVGGSGRELAYEEFNNPLFMSSPGLETVVQENPLLENIDT